MSERLSDSWSLTGRRPRAFALAAAALCLLLAGCASIEAPPAPAGAAPVAASALGTTDGAPASPERKRLIDAFGGEYHAPQTESYLDNVLVKLAPVSNGVAEPYRVALLNSPVVNAF